jgi:hypothetical protein
MSKDLTTKTVYMLLKLTYTFFSSRKNFLEVNDETFRGKQVGFVNMH